MDLVAASAQTKAICFALKLRDFNSEGKVNGYFSSEQIVDRPRRPTPAMLLKLSLTALSRCCDASMSSWDRTSLVRSALWPGDLAGRVAA